jgi:protein-L-isoaspartate O-methyltransferase
MVVFPEALKLKKHMRGLLTSRDILWIKHYAKGRKAILDIGGFSGYSACILSGDNIKITSFEWFRGLPKPTSEDVGWIEGDYKSDKEIYLHNINTYGKNITLLEGDAVENIKQINNFDFCFVDLDLYEPTLHIFEYLYSKLDGKKDVTIITHDYCSSGIQKASQFLINKPNIKFKQIGNLGIFRYTK